MCCKYTLIFAITTQSLHLLLFFFLVVVVVIFVVFFLNSCIAFMYMYLCIVFVVYILRASWNICEFAKCCHTH